MPIVLQRAIQTQIYGDGEGWIYISQTDPELNSDCVCLTVDQFNQMLILADQIRREAVEPNESL
jgi:hypothetical protein